MSQTQPSVLSHVRPAPPYPTLRRDPNIQGNVLAGFNKDHQAFLFLQLAKADKARAYLGELHATTSPGDAVAEFNERFSAARRSSGGADPPSLTAVWVSVAITARGFEVLAPTAFTALAARDDNPGLRAFLAGAAARAAEIGDTGSNEPNQWLFGRPGQRIDVVVTVAADRADALAFEMQRQRELAACYDSLVVFEQLGGTLTGVRRGHEHFGFRDGIGQPGVMGYDEESRHRPGEVADRPGTLLLPPGEFVLGYDSGRRSAQVLPRWMWDGSFVVIRRLAQDVPGWWGQLGEISVASGIPTERLAARAVGRWRSGCPTDRNPTHDVRTAATPASDNDFDYSDDVDAIRTAPYAHIRAMNPRAMATWRNELRPILRRGIPFGPHFDPAAGRGHGADAERGLVFVSYQSDIARQFEPLYSLAFGSPAGGGPAPGELSLSFHRFVRTQGGVYAFTPSMSTLEALAAGAQLV